MDISLVICTRNRAAQLERCLKSLKGLQYKGIWEVIVVDNGSTDNTQAIIEKCREDLPCPLITAVEGKAGLGRARNKGWRLAQGEIIAFTDDDCYPETDFLDAVIQVFKDNSLGFTGGRILLYDPTDYRITILESNVRQHILPKSFIPAGTIQGANFAIRREAIEAVNGFDGNFGAGALFPCEDIDIAARISAAGWHGTYDPKPVIYHHHGRKTEAEAQKLMKQYDRGRGAYYAKGLLNPAIRQVIFRNWLWNIRHQACRKTVRELYAATEYFARRLLHL